MGTKGSFISPPLVSFSLLLYIWSFSYLQRVASQKELTLFTLTQAHAYKIAAEDIFFGSNLTVQWFLYSHLKMENNFVFSMQLHLKIFI